MELAPVNPPAQTHSPTFSPLYRQIRGLILRSLESGEWGPGELIPSESELAERFARRVPNRFEGVEYELSHTGLPILQGAVAWFECHNRSRHEEGDHVIFVGEVEQCRYRPGASPLIFHGGRFYTELPL